MNRRTLTFAALLLALVLMMTACAAPVSAPAGPAAGEGEAAADEGATTITWAMWGSPEEIATHQAVADAFMAEHPEIQIEIQGEPWGDYFTKIQALWASGDSSVIPDVAFLWPAPRYAAEGVLENLDPWIEESGYDLGDYWPALLESASFDGSVYGFPRDIGLEVLYYNKDMFDDAGLEYPNETWTWDDLTAAAEALTVVDASGRVERYGLGMQADRGKAAIWILQNGGAWLDDVRNPSRCILNEPEGIAALEFFAGLMDNNFAMRPDALSQAGGDAGAFSSGQVAMIIQNASRVSAFNEAGLNYDVAPIPVSPTGERAASAGGAAWVMSAGSDSKEAAWTFLSWLQSTDGGQRIYTDSGEIFPALQSVANSDAFLKPDLPPANRQAFLIEGSAATVGSFGYFPEWGEIEGSIINPGLDTIWAGEATPAEAADAICAQIDALLADSGYPK